MLTAAGCGGGGGSGGGDPQADPPPAGDAWRWTLPAGYPAPAVPADNPMSAEKVALGRFLFHDRRLSGNRSLSCASCHQQAKAFTDGFDRPRGATGIRHPRNAQGLVNVAYNRSLTWADPTQTLLEVQMRTPLFGTAPIEMGVNDENRELVLARIADDPDYASRFRRVWPDGEPRVTWTRIIAAIAAFQRTIVSADSRHDRFLAGRETLSAAESRGRALFFGERGGCSRCHGGLDFNQPAGSAGSDGDGGNGQDAAAIAATFHNTGLYNLDGAGSYPAPNRGLLEITGRTADMGRFRTPSLRNVAVTPPYMHDGSLGTLEAVLAFYAAGGRTITDGPLAGDGRTNPYRSPLLRHDGLTPAEQADIIAFLRSLTDAGLLTDPAFADPFAAPAGRTAADRTTNGTTTGTTTGRTAMDGAATDR